MNNTKDILKLIFAEIGENPSDAALARCAGWCAGASVALLAAMKDDEMREAVLEERDATTADCVRRIVEALKAVDRGELEAVSKH